MSSEEGTLGEGSRLTEGPSPLMAEFTFGAELDTYSNLWRWLSIADMAHVRELDEAGVFPSHVADSLLAGLHETHSSSPPKLEASLGDVYNNRDAFLRDRLGEVADWVHTGRARREATTLAWQLETRVAIERAVRRIAELVGTLVNLAEEHTQAVMSDFTYLQHAQPTTLAHYLLGFAYPLRRDIDRLNASLSLVNSSPAGSGSVNGTRFAIDRERIAADLEFDGVIVHTRDAMWAPDMAIDTAAATTSALVTIDRLSEELQVWASSEFGYFTPADRHTRTSVIMPQKKNPYGLAMIRGQCRQQLGDLVSVIATNLTVSGQPDNRVLSYGSVPKGLERLAGVAGLLAEHLSEGHFDTARMRHGASSGFTSSTEICDWLMEQASVSNRHAHRLVGLAVRRAIEHERDVLQVSDLMDAAAELELARPEIDAEVLAELQDPDSVLASRKGTGSAREVGRMIRDLRDSIDSLPDSRFEGFEGRYLASIRARVEERRAE